MAFKAFSTFWHFEVKFPKVQLAWRQIIGLKPHIFSGADRTFQTDSVVILKTHVSYKDQIFQENIPLSEDNQ